MKKNIISKTILAAVMVSLTLSAGCVRKDAGGLSDNLKNEENKTTKDDKLKAVVKSDMKKESNKMDNNELKAANGEKIELKDYTAIWGWINDNTLVLSKGMREDSFALLNVNLKEEKIVKPESFKNNIEINDFKNKKFLCKDYEKNKYFIYDLTTDSRKDIYDYDFKKQGNSEYAKFADEEGRYIYINYSNKDVYKMLIDTESYKVAKIDEKKINEDWNDPMGVAFSDLVYSGSNKEFYAFYHNKIYQFNFEEPDKLKLKAKLNKDIYIWQNIHVINNGKSVLFEASEERRGFVDGYIYDFSTGNIKKVVSYRIGGEDMSSAFSFNSKSNLIFSQEVDKKSNVIHPYVAEIKGNELVNKFEVFAPEQMKNNGFGIYEGYWNANGTKILLKVNFAEDGKLDGTPTKDLKVTYRVIDTRKK